MKLIYCVCVAAFFVFMNSGSVTSLSEEVKQLAGVMVADYLTVQDDFNSGTLKFTIKPVNLPRIDFGNSITFSTEEKNTTATTRASILVLIQINRIFQLREYLITNAENVNDPESLTSDQLQYLGHGCDKGLNQDGQTYYGIVPACLSPPGSNENPLVFRMKLNCSILALAFGNENIILTPTTRLSLPDEWKPTNPLC